MRVSDDQSVLLKNHETSFKFCLLWKDANSCEHNLDDDVHPSCLVSYYDFKIRNFLPPVPTANKFWNLIDFSRWKEGIYWFDCNEPSAKIRIQFSRVILNKGHYEMDCSSAPDVIYLDRSRKDHLFCRWDVVVSKAWKKIARHMQAGKGATYCYSSPKGLVFDRGLLKTKVRDMLRGFVKVFCKPGSFQKVVLIAGRFAFHESFALSLEFSYHVYIRKYRCINMKQWKPHTIA